MAKLISQNAKKGLINVKIENVDSVKRQIVNLIKRGCGRAVKEANIEVFNMIQKSGNVPKLSGRLRSSGRAGIKSLYGKNSWVMGWTTPYAKTRYFGVGQEKTSVKNSKGRMTQVITGRNGIPFWDRPITQNSALMRQILQKHKDKRVKN